MGSPKLRDDGMWLMFPNQVELGPHCSNVKMCARGVRKLILQINISEQVLTFLLQEHRYVETLFCESENRIDNNYLP